MKINRINWYDLLFYFLMFFGIIFLIVDGRKKDIKSKKELKHFTDSVLTEKISKRNHLDTLYWHHLEQCSFEQKVFIEPDINN